MKEPELSNSTRFKRWDHCPKCMKQPHDGFCFCFMFYGKHGSDRYGSCIDCGDFPFPESQDSKPASVESSDRRKKSEGVQAAGIFQPSPNS